jgi:predicted nucleic acid-binding protein
MPTVIVSDTSCLILFYKIGELELLHKIYGVIVITETVSEEFKKPLPDWIQIQNPRTNLHRGLMSFLDIGEATSIALAAELPDCLLIIDESKGRRVAKEMGIRITGSLGSLIAAKEKGIIHSLKPILDKIMQTNFRISDELVNKILHLVSEK